ncbi:hypothetical protein HK098_005346 [Nowakowskiella sp. JEL0407]|nr:hypothetical protein HK098_005346 [Nowakowskiella sp. JEL0407]
MDLRRKFHAVENSVYPLPADAQEQDRLSLQHLLYRLAFNELFHMPIHVQMITDGLRILDVGCGPGDWTRDVARSYPLAEVWGLDMAQSLFEGVEVLPNMKFFTGNVLGKLPFPDNTFDGVYQRLLIGGIPKDKWDQVIQELMHLLKPGGYLELCEPDLTYFRTGPNYQKLMNGLNESLAQRGLDPLIARDLPKKMSEAGLKIISQHSCSFPVGWGGKHGDLHLINAHQGVTALKPFLLKSFGVSEQEYDQLVVDAIAECPQNKTYYNAYSIVGQKI